MAITLFQKIKLAIRGWSRRSEESSARKKAEFLQRETSWAKPSAPAASPVSTERAEKSKIDRDGLQVAFLDDSGHFEHYLDTETGDVIDHRIGETLPFDAAPRYRRVPRRSPESEAADRVVFLTALESDADRELLASSVHDARLFRAQLGKNRLLEKRWYNFKNDQANDVIEAWLRQIGASG